MARDLATSVELLAAAIETIPADGLDQSDGEQLWAAVEASVQTLRRIRRRLLGSTDA